MEIQVEIETHDTHLDFDLLDTKELRSGMEKTIGKGVAVKYRGTLVRLAVDVPSIIEITIFIGKDIVMPILIGILTNWLYDKIKGRAVKLRIERTEVEIDKGQIKKILIEKIEQTNEE